MKLVKREPWGLSLCVQAHIVYSPKEAHIGYKCYLPVDKGNLLALLLFSAVRLSLLT